MTTELERVRELVAPIAGDLDLDLYDVLRDRDVIRVVLDTPPGSDGGISLDTLSLATRLISREIDHEDPVPGRFTLEVTSPGLERRLRTPAHFQREVGKDVTMRLAGHAVAEGEQRRVDGRLASATDDEATIALDDGSERVIAYAQIDKARTVFEWGAAPKPGGPKKKNKASDSSGAASAPTTSAQQEKQQS